MNASTLVMQDVKVANGQYWIRTIYVTVMFIRKARWLKGSGQMVKADN